MAAEQQVLGRSTHKPLARETDRLSDHDEDSSSGNRARSPISWRAMVGPGLLACLADTDAGCLIVAAQSGARWGYSLLLLQVLLIPVLFYAQELTVRLGVYTKKGHTACIKEHFGAFWAWLATALLAFECLAAMISEMSGLAAVAELWGLDRIRATFIAAAVIVGVIFSCNYRQVEVIGVSLGLCELTFVFTMVWFHPSPTEVFKGMFTLHSDVEYIKLIAANIGAVIMPWMIYFQQSAVVARRLSTQQDLHEERSKTLMGSVLTQLVMIAALVTMAGAYSATKNLEDVQQIVDALTPALGSMTSRTLVSLSFVGGSLCAAFVVSLAASWAVCEAAGWESAYSLDDTPMNAPHFYATFLAVVLTGVIVLLSGVNVVWLSVFVELLDGLLLPFAVGFLFLLATGDALPPEARVVGAHKVALAVVFSVCTIVSLVTGIYGLVGEPEARVTTASLAAATVKAYG